MGPAPFLLALEYLVNMGGAMDCLGEAGRITIGGILGKRMAACISERVLAQEIEPLVRPFRERNDGPDGFRGEFWGKWFTSLVLAWTYRPCGELAEKMCQAVDALLGTQTSDGCISTYRDSEQQGTWDAWSRKYVLLGLLHHHRATGEARSLEAACRVLDHFMTQAGPGKLRLADSGHWAWQGLPPSSMLEPVAMLARLSGREDYLRFGEWIISSWSEPSQFLPEGLRLVESALAGAPAREIGNPKAYEQMSCFEGLCEMYLATGNRRYREAAIALGKSIRETERSVVGSGSNHEMWCETARYQTEVLGQPQETCATVTWMKLCHRLLQLTGSPEWADELELSLFNALPAAMKPDGSWWTYYAPLVGERVASHMQYADVGLSCCVASGPRGLLLTHQWAVMRDDDGAVVINLFAPGSAEVILRSGERVTLEQETNYPRSGDIHLTLRSRSVNKFILRLRIPAWSREGRVESGNEVIATEAGSYLSLEREWRDGDSVTLHLDMRTRAIPAPSGAPAFALARGPLVLVLDSRLAQPDDRALLLDVGPDGHVAAVPVPSPDPAVYLACEVPFINHRIHIEKLPTTLLMCDYASAGNSWSAGSRFRTWLPQPLFLRQAFVRGTELLQGQV